MKLDLEQIRNLIGVVSETNVTELTIESGEEKITIKKATPPAYATTVELPQLLTSTAALSNPRPASAPQAQASTDEPAGDSEESNGWVPISSPMVGTFYRASSPAAKPFIEIGDRIASGQTVCIIEAMKLMNDLPAEISGRIVKVCVENGSTVEYGQPLFLVDPKG